LPDRATRVGNSTRSGTDAPGRVGRSGSRGSRGRKPDELGAQFEGPELGREETLLVVLRGIGAMMFLTTRRVIVARDGIERRPRSGVASFPLEQIRHLRLELGSGPSGRIAVWTDASQEALSMFFDARSLDRAHKLIDVARPQIARQRRRGPGERPARPPTGPADSGRRDPA
jgi:hypothetical protein